MIYDILGWSFACFCLWAMWSANRGMSHRD